MTGRQQLWIVVAAAILIAAATTYLLWPDSPPPVTEAPVAIEVAPEVDLAPVVTERVIGQSVEGRDINVVSFGRGETDLLFVGGVHGGYEWNSALLAYAMIDHFEINPDAISENLTVHIIPDLNPDGTALASGKESGGRFAATDITDPTTRLAAGRFNANDVDLNRNFDCKWAPESTWRGNVVSAGSEPFSEPEAAALRDFVLEITPAAAVFWHSQANNVYASECEAGVLPETLELMETYAVPANYGQVPVFDAYPITGDVEGWLASINIPAITVELESFRSIEWERNIAGVNAVLDLYSTVPTAAE